jgi:hypothetical protein
MQPLNWRFGTLIGLDPKPKGLMQGRSTRRPAVAGRSGVEEAHDVRQVALGSKLGEVDSSP